MKNKANIYQLLLVALGAFAVIGLYFFGKTTQPLTIEAASEAFASQQEVIEFDEKTFRNNAELVLTEEESSKLQSTTSSDKVSFWQSVDRNDVAAIESKAIAEKENNFTTWNTTGDLFIRAFRESTDSLEQAYFLQECVSSYEKSLDFQQDITTKLKLAKIHTSLTGATMEGVMLLQEIVTEEPKHIQANYELAMLSLQSGQIDKALARFDLLIEEEPAFIEPYIFKAQILLDRDEKIEAVEVLDSAIANTSNQEGIKVLQEMKNNIK